MTWIKTIRMEDDEQRAQRHDGATQTVSGGICDASADRGSTDSRTALSGRTA